MAAALLAIAALLVALGVWQVERRAWKHRLVQTVEARVHAAPVAAPGPDRWPSITAESDAYRHVATTGHYRAGSDTLVQAVTERGSGYWVLTPLDTGEFTILVNRGFVPQDARARAHILPQGPVTVTGLLRISEPKGGFLRANDPANGRWYSRDVAAIAAARRLSPIAPYFIDAAASPDGRGPVGGLTVIRFADNHAVYAATWFALALLACWGAWHVLRSDRPAERAAAE